MRILHFFFNPILLIDPWGAGAMAGIPSEESKGDSAGLSAIEYTDGFKEEAEEEYKEGLSSKALEGNHDAADEDKEESPEEASAAIPKKATAMGGKPPIIAINDEFLAKPYHKAARNQVLGSKSSAPSVSSKNAPVVSQTRKMALRVPEGKEEEGF